MTDQPLSDVERRKLAVEKLIDVSAQWGYYQARKHKRRGYLKPIIVWNDDNEPTIANADA